MNYTLWGVFVTLVLAGLIIGISLQLFYLITGDSLYFGQEYCNTLSGGDEATIASASEHFCDISCTNYWNGMCVEHDFIFNETRFASAMGNVQT